MTTLLYYLKKLIPGPVFRALQPVYHYLLAWVGAVIYRHPSRELTVIAITGTKGKSTVTELLGAILRADGKKIATASTIQFSIGDETTANKFKMTMPGRFFLQSFLRRATNADCEYAIVEMTSEGAKQYRHKFVELSALVFTNLTPEHIESHGGFEAYKACKLRLAEAVTESKTHPKYLVANIDDEHGRDFLNFDVDHKLPYSLNDIKLYNCNKESITLIYDRPDGELQIRVPIVGKFNVYNTLAAITIARALGVEFSVIKEALAELAPVKGRAELIKSTNGKAITAVVDYAHTIDSLEQLYKAFPPETAGDKICILGNTGGGRDTWKRPGMAKVAETNCDHIILTNEDPYDEDPKKIVHEMADAIEDKEKLEIVMDRRTAIKKALESATENSTIIISGKGTDPYIMGPKNTKTPWSDAAVVREEMEKQGLL